ncbi:MAG TPA: glycosyltransferase family 4 protein [Candidatus Nanoarchaeia archaeon]|nr:glycosyltransferase family 4 protein [Candidatus Nanoarchaeia archaeon]
MHLCMITEYFPESAAGEVRGGVEMRAFHCARQLARHHQVTVLTSYAHGRAHVQTIDRVRVLRCGKLPYTHSGALLSRLRFAWSVLRSARLLAADPPDIVEGENFLCYLPTFALAKKFRAKSIAVYHESWIGSWIRHKGLITGFFGSVWERFALRKPWDAMIAVSNITKHQLVMNGIAPHRVTVVPNGVDPLNYPTPELIPTKYPRTTICCIARLTPEKHVDTIIRALVLLVPQHPDIQLKIIGVGAEEQFLRTLADTLEVSDRVEFLGFLPSHAAVVEVLARSHLLCSASTLEGFGIAILEAMACGIPFVCSRIPAHEEITQHGQGGMLFAAGNAEDLSEKVHFLLVHPKEYQKRSAQGRARASHFSWSQIGTQLEKKYLELLA